MTLILHFTFYKLLMILPFGRENLHFTFYKLLIILPFGRENSANFYMVLWSNLKNFSLSL